jgi:hypothetical protein
LGGVGEQGGRERIGPLDQEQVALVEVAEFAAEGPHGRQRRHRRRARDGVRAEASVLVGPE